MSDLLEQFGSIDIYLFDQLLRGNIRAGMRVLDAGCGGGRNLTYLLREGFECFGVDRSAEAIGMCGRWREAGAGFGGGELSGGGGGGDVVRGWVCGCGDLQRGAALCGG